MQSTISQSFYKATKFEKPNEFPMEATGRKKNPDFNKKF